MGSSSLCTTKLLKYKTTCVHNYYRQQELNIIIGIKPTAPKKMLDIRFGITNFKLLFMVNNPLKICEQINIQ